MITIKERPAQNQALNFCTKSEQLTPDEAYDFKNMGIPVDSNNRTVSEKLTIEEVSWLQESN